MLKRISFVVFVLSLSVTMSGFSQSAPTGITPVHGLVANVSGDMLTVTSQNNSVKIHLGNQLTVYTNRPSDLSHVTSNAFIGVTSVKQSDGSERATEIHIFPEELRGTGEGSFLISPNQAKSASGSRMTNGTVSTLKATNGSTSGSRMTNGTVSTKSGASTISVQYGGGVQTISIPPNVAVTALTPISGKPKQGDNVFVLPKKQADGSLIATKIISAGPAK